MPRECFVLAPLPPDRNWGRPKLFSWAVTHIARGQNCVASLQPLSFPPSNDPRSQPSATFSLFLPIFCSASSFCCPSRMPARLLPLPLSFPPHRGIRPKMKQKNRQHAVGMATVMILSRCWRRLLPSFPFMRFLLILVMVFGSFPLSTLSPLSLLPLAVVLAAC